MSRNEYLDLLQINDLVELANAVSDVVWGGEHGWERTGVKALTKSFRQWAIKRRAVEPTPEKSPCGCDFGKCQGHNETGP